MSISPSYDQARIIISKLRGMDGLSLSESNAAMLQAYATLAVAEALMEIGGLLRAQDARVRREARGGVPADEASSGFEGQG